MVRHYLLGAGERQEMAATLIGDPDLLIRIEHRAVLIALI